MKRKILFLVDKHEALKRRERFLLCVMGLLCNQKCQNVLELTWDDAFYQIISSVDISKEFTINLSLNFYQNLHGMISGQKTPYTARLAEGMKEVFQQM